MMRKLLTILLLLLYLMLPRSALAQTATPVNPDLSWSTASIELTLYVATTGNDTNAGTSTSAPFKTISKAVQTALSSGKRTKVRISPGTYRETVNIQAASGKMLILEATESGKVIVSGSDVWGGWASVGSDVYSHAWTNNWGVQPYVWDNNLKFDPIGRRREIVFVNGELYKQVEARTTLNSTPKTYFVSESEDKLYLHLPAGTSASSATIEVGVRDQVLYSTVPNLVVRGMVFQHAPNGLYNPEKYAVTIGSNNLFEDSVVQWNNYNGLFFGSNSVIRRNKLNHNGATGLGGYKTINTLLEDNETSYNNWRAAMGGFHGWATGQKIFRVRGITIRRHTSFHNQSYGLWFDWDNINVIIEDSVFCYNDGHGLMLEASQGPFLVRNNIFCGNHLEPNADYPADGGLLISSAENVTVENNIFYDNERSQIMFVGSTRNVQDWQTLVTRGLMAKDITLKNNIIMGTESSQELLRFKGGSNYSPFISSLTSENNTWFHPTLTTTPLQGMSFSAWQAGGKDKSSKWQNPNFLNPNNCIFYANRRCDSLSPSPTITPIPTATPQPTASSAPGVPGDANGDGKVTGLDYTIWLKNYGKSVSNGATSGDFNNNSKVDGLDYTIWLANWNI